MSPATMPRRAPCWTRCRAAEPQPLRRIRSRRRSAYPDHINDAPTISFQGIQGRQIVHVAISKITAWGRFAATRGQHDGVQSPTTHLGRCKGTTEDNILRLELHMPFWNITPGTCPTKRAETPPDSDDTETRPCRKLLIKSTAIVGSLHCCRNLCNQTFRESICLNVRVHLDFRRQHAVRQLCAIRQLQDITLILKATPQSITQPIDQRLHGTPSIEQQEPPPARRDLDDSAFAML